MKHLAILGSTGSIGTNALSVVKAHPEEFVVSGLAAYASVDLMERQVREFRPQRVALNDEVAALELRRRLGDLNSVEVLSGAKGVLAVATMDVVDLMLDGIGGSAGLLPTLEAIKARKDIAFVNKEVLVMCGALVMQAVKDYDVNLLPIDGEMSAIFQCLSNLQQQNEIQRLLLTASGGPFRQTPAEQFMTITPQQALQHPTWKMGKKITIDCATLLNKGLEVIEAKWLFGINPSQIEILIHPESIIHSMIEYVDGSLLAQLSTTDMRIPIQYALTYPRRLPSPTATLNFPQIGVLHFESVDFDKFPCLALAYTAAEVGGTLPAVLSSADEVVVRAFLDEQIGFTDIPKILKSVIDQHDVELKPSFDNILAADRWAKSTAHEVISQRNS